MLLWDVKSLSVNNLKFKYDTVSLTSILKRAEIEWVNIENENEYPILGVRGQGEGVYINKVAKGHELNMRKYQVSKPYHLFFCKVRTVKGQWGVIYPEFSNSFGSSNMQYLEIDLSSVYPNYLELLLKIKTLTDEWDKNAVGADGRHFPLNILLNLKIPLPKLSKQKELVDAYTKLINISTSQKNKADELENEIERYLLDELGIELKENKLGKGLQFIQYRNLKRWDVSYLINDVSISSRYNIISLKSCIDNFLKDDNNKSLRFESYNYPNEKFRYIGMEHIEKNIGMYNNPPLIFGTEIKSQTNIVPFGYFIYGKLRPYLNKYWLNENQNEKIICSSEFFVFKLKEHINKYFFQYVLSSTIVQFQISELTSGARMPRINESVFKGIQIPLPSIEKQNEIANHISLLKKEIKNLREEAEKNKALALAQFENEIFG